MANVRKDRIVDNWMTIVENGAGNSDRVYRELDMALKHVGIPQVSWSRGDVNAGLMARGREFLIVKHGGLREYTMYVYARDIGTHLDCGWYMTAEPGFFKSAFSKKLTGNPVALSQALGVFSQQDLSAWTHIVHRMLVKIARDLMREMQQDIAGMNTTSKGYLSVW
jgi:hypothetical protein